MSEKRTSGAATGNIKPSTDQGLLFLQPQATYQMSPPSGMQGQQKVPSKHEKKNNFPQDFDIDMDNPETEKAAVAIQSQFRKYQKKKQDVKS
ncbi:calmodulin regulator protein PCP4a isoform X2 [Kryptolebias marmoratus]|uniref:calmodulin regulator protein PCP4a isoform X2 n=1 Tax=Kryptolebias marmoratus TaxID=37003 RepID=UPI0018ACFC81|nr:calmodulin regulator protein PCP4a isoform X2 [Kryptolebias marmoratus]